MYGMTNSGTGAGGGLSVNAAVLHVSAPFGSTVDISKGGVVVKTLGPGKAHTNVDGENADYYFSITPSNYGTWTATGTLSDKSKSKTITVNSNSQYDVILQYGFELYTPGDVHTDVTGGWSATTGGGYVQFGSESINFTNADYFPIVSTDGKIPLSDYSTLFVDIKANNYGVSGNIFAGIANSRITADNQFAARVQKITTGRETLSLDISAYDDSKYVAIAGYHSNANIYNVWLE